MYLKIRHYWLIFPEGISYLKVTIYFLCLRFPLFIYLIDLSCRNLEDNAAPSIILGGNFLLTICRLLEGFRHTTGCLCSFYFKFTLFSSPIHDQTAPWYLSGSSCDVMLLVFTALPRDPCVPWQDNWVWCSRVLYRTHRRGEFRTRDSTHDIPIIKVLICWAEVTENFSFVCVWIVS